MQYYFQEYRAFLYYELKDFKTMQFLHWFVKEQGEEEKNSDDLWKRYELYGQD